MLQWWTFNKILGGKSWVVDIWPSVLEILVLYTFALFAEHIAQFLKNVYIFLKQLSCKGFYWLILFPLPDLFQDWAITSLASFAHFPFSAALAASSRSISLLWSLQKKKVQLRGCYTRYIWEYLWFLINQKHSAYSDLSWLMIMLVTIYSNVKSMQRPRNSAYTYSLGLMPPLLTSNKPSITLCSVTFVNWSPKNINSKIYL